MQRTFIRSPAMGAFYGSIHVRTDDVDAVRKVLDSAAKRKWKFLVSPIIDGWVAVYPSQHGQDERVSKAIAKELDSPILHVAVHDDDVFYYWYYRDGKVIDRFSSCPEYFGQISPRMKILLRGKPERLADLLTIPGDLQRLLGLVEAMRTEPLFASDRPEQFAKLFGLSNVSTSYEYLMADETEGVERWDEFVHVPDLSEERRAEQEVAARIQRQKDRLREEGKLLAELSMGQSSSNVPSQFLWCVDAANNLFLGESNLFERRETEVQMIPPPWTDDRKPLGITVAPQAVAMAASPNGRYLAVGYAGGTWKADLWDAEQKKHLLEIKHTSAVYSMAFTSDERLLFTMSPHEIVVTNLASGERAAEWKIENGQAMDLHPSGRMLAFGRQDGFSVFNVEAGEARALRLGQYQDLSALREYLQGELRQEIEKSGSDWVTSQVQRTLKQLGISEDSKAGKRMRDDTEKSMNDVLSGKAFEHLGERTFQPENVSCVRFVGAGKYLACVTEKALRIFDLDRVLSVSDGEVEPLYSVQPTPVPHEYGYLSGYIYAAVDDPETGGVLFGGLDGSIRSLVLATGEIADLFSPPGTPPIMQMKLVGGHTLFCLCQPGFPETHGKRQPLLLQIWDRKTLAG